MARLALTVLLGALGLSGVIWAQEAGEPPRPPRAEHEATSGLEARPLARPAPAVPEDKPADSPADVAETAAQEPATPPMPPAFAQAEFAVCRLGLQALGVGFQPQPPINSDTDPACGIARPVLLTALAQGVAVDGEPLTTCPTALRLALWLHREVAPAAAALPGSPRVERIATGPGYQCRERVGDGSAKLSEHATGAAIDVTGFGFSDGSRIDIASRDAEGSMAEAFQKAVRHGACLYFTTVLGPGSNAAHDTHLHFDSAARKGGWRICE